LLLRLTVEPSVANGLRVASQLMIDKITTVSKRKLERRVGRLEVEDVVRLNRAVLVFLGLAGAASSGREPN
jgi:mRNA interferase MazF